MALMNIIRPPASSCLRDSSTTPTLASLCRRIRQPAFPTEARPTPLCPTATHGTSRSTNSPPTIPQREYLSDRLRDTPMDQGGGHGGQLRARHVAGLGGGGPAESGQRSF